MLAFALWPLLAAPASAAQVYKWVDEHGRVQYGDQPPSAGATKVEVQNAPAPDPGLAQDRETQQKLLDGYEEDAKDRQQHKAESQAQVELHRANCDKARMEAEDTRNARFLYESTGDPANPRVLTEEERAKATHSADAAVQKWCGSTAARP